MIVRQEIVLEFGRLALVYMHLIACCVAVGLVLKSDFAMLKDMIQPKRTSARASRAQMDELQSIVAFALIGLWGTGAAIVTFDALSKDGWQYFANPKIQAKILIVVLLTLNGIVLHNLVLPWMQKAGTLLKMSFNRVVLATFAGTVSAVSWLYAAMLGVGRPLAWKYSLGQLMAAYPALIAGGFVSMMVLVTWCKVRSQRPLHGIDVSSYAPTRSGS